MYIYIYIQTYICVCMYIGFRVNPKLTQAAAAGGLLDLIGSSLLLLNHTERIHLVLLTLCLPFCVASRLGVGGRLR